MTDEERGPVSYYLSKRTQNRIAEMATKTYRGKNDVIAMAIDELYEKLMGTPVNQEPQAQAASE